MWEQLRILAQDMIEPGASGHHRRRRARVASPPATSRCSPGSPGSAPAIEAAQPAFEWQFIPFPGSDDAADNQYVFGKYDQGWAIDANTPNKDAALAYLAEFSDPANYQAFVTAVGAIPTQPTRDARHASWASRSRPTSTTSGSAGSCYWVLPTGAGQFAIAVRLVLHALRHVRRPPRKPPTRPRPTSRPGWTPTSSRQPSVGRDASGAPRPLARGSIPARRDEDA